MIMLSSVAKEIEALYSHCSLEEDTSIQEESYTTFQKRWQYFGRIIAKSCDSPNELTAKIKEYCLMPAVAENTCLTKSTAPNSTVTVAATADRGDMEPARITSKRKKRKKSKRRNKRNH